MTTRRMTAYDGSILNRFPSLIDRSRPAGAAGIGGKNADVATRQAALACFSRNLTASPTVWICSAASSGNLAAELLLERHHEFDRVQAVGAQIVDEAGVVGDLVGLHAEMLDNDLLHALCDIAHRIYPSALADLMFMPCSCEITTGDIVGAYARS